jgi:hypothetical protein
MTDKCSYCGDPNFKRMNPDISDFCLLLKSECLPPKNGVSIDVFIQPPLEEEKRFCGFRCLEKWIVEKKEMTNG